MLRAVCVVPVTVAAVMLVEVLQWLVQESAYGTRLIEIRALSVNTCGINCEKLKGSAAQNGVMNFSCS